MSDENYFTWVLFNPHDILFHDHAISRFEKELIPTLNILKYGKKEQIAIRNKLKDVLNSLNYYELYKSELNDFDKKKSLSYLIPLRDYNRKYEAFRDFVYAQKKYLKIDNSDEHKIYLKEASGRNAAKKLASDVKEKIKAYHTKYKNNGPKKDLINTFVKAIESYDIDKLTSDGFEAFLKNKLEELQVKEKEYYLQNVPSCFSCFTFFYQQRSSLQPLINEAKKMVMEYKKQNEPNFNTKVPGMAPKK